MVEVRREYVSSLRDAQARATRRVIVDAAARLFIEDGYGLTTIEAVALAAGVSRKTVFTSAGGKAELLKLAIDFAAVGDGEPTPLVARPVVRQLGTSTEPAEVLAGYVGIVTDIGSRLAELSQVLVAAAALDSQVRAIRENAVAQRLTGARAFIRHLARCGGVRPALGIPAAADIAWFYSDPVVYHRLVNERHWTQTRFQTWLLSTLSTQLLPDGAAK